MGPVRLLEDLGDLMRSALYALHGKIVVQRIDDVGQILIHIGGHIVVPLHEFGRAVCEIRRDQFGEHTFFIEFIEFFESFREQTESRTDEDPVRAAGFDLPTDIQHGSAGGDHIIDDDAVLTLDGIAEEFMGNDRILAVHDL